MEGDTYNSYFPTKLRLDLAFLVGIGTFFPDDREELLDTHLCGGCGVVVSCCVIVVQSKWWY